MIKSVIEGDELLRSYFELSEEAKVEEWFV